MKILFFTNEYSHPKLPASGGVGSFLKTISNELVALGQEVHIYGFSKRKIELEDGQIKIKFFKKYSKQFPFSEFLRSLCGKLNIKNAERFFLKKERQYLAKQLKNYSKENGIEIIESFVFGGFSAYWDNSIPMVIRFHGSRGFWHYYLGAKKEEHKIFMEQKALENTPYTVAVSKSSAEAVKTIYNVPIDKVIYNGIDAQLFSPNADVKEIEHSIFYFGTLSKAKGVDILCNVFNTIIEKYPKSTLHLIGRGSEFFDDLKSNVLSEKALKNVTYYGAMQLEDLPKSLSQSTVCVFPSLNETFGLIVTEAMSMEKPVIASDIPSFNEIIDHELNGFIAKNIEDYSNYISFIFENQDKAKLISLNARQKVLQNFTQEKMTEDTLSYYKKIISK